MRADGHKVDTISSDFSSDGVFQEPQVSLVQAEADRNDEGRREGG